MRSPAQHPNSVADYRAGLAAARAGEPRREGASAWWLYGYQVADDARMLDEMLDGVGE